MARVGISKKLRFEVFKRDKFTCQYCGGKAPEVVLNADHVKPVAEGGTTDIMNLITACFACNSGKSDRELSDSAALQKQHGQIAALEDRRQQIEMMAQWRSELENLDEMTAVMAEEAWYRAIEHDATLREPGKQDIRKWVKRHGLEAVFNGITAAASSYLQRDEDSGKYSIDSINHAFNMIPRVISVQKQSVSKPYLQRLFYARGILRKRLSYVNERQVMQVMEDAVSWGADPESLVDIAKTVGSWTHFRNVIDEYIANERETQKQGSGDGENS